MDSSSICWRLARALGPVLSWRLLGGQRVRRACGLWGNASPVSQRICRRGRHRVATTAVPILFSLRPSTASDGVGLGSCGLSAAEQEAVRAMVGSWENSSMCSYNQTLDDILAGG